MWELGLCFRRLFCLDYFHAFHCLFSYNSFILNSYFGKNGTCIQNWAEIGCDRDPLDQNMSFCFHKILLININNIMSYIDEYYFNCKWLKSMLTMWNKKGGVREIYGWDTEILHEIYRGVEQTHSWERINIIRASVFVWVRVFLSACDFCIFL